MSPHWMARQIVCSEPLPKLIQDGALLSWEEKETIHMDCQHLKHLDHLDQTARVFGTVGA